MKVKLRFSAPSTEIAEIEDLIEFTTPCHESQVVGSYRVSNPFSLTIPAAKSKDCTTASQRLLNLKSAVREETLAFSHFWPKFTKDYAAKCPKT